MAKVVTLPKWPQLTAFRCAVCGSAHCHIFALPQDEAQPISAWCTADHAKNAGWPWLSSEAPKRSRQGLHQAG